MKDNNILFKITVLTIEWKVKSEVSKDESFG